MQKQYGSKRGKTKLLFELFAEPDSYKSLLITSQGRRIREQEFDMTFDKKLYFNIDFDDVRIKVYTSKYNKGLPKKPLNN